jgi:hypothetical protein
VLIPIQIPQLPSAEGAKGRSAESQDERQKPAVAWQREMERAQMALWLRQGALGQGTAQGAVHEVPVLRAPLVHASTPRVDEAAPQGGSGFESSEPQDSLDAVNVQHGGERAQLDSGPQFGGTTFAFEWTPPAFAAALDQRIDAHAIRGEGGTVPVANRLARVWSEAMPGAVTVPVGPRTLPHSGAKAPTALAQSAPPTQEKAPPPVQQPPVRVQYHLSEAGLAVWLGVDRGVALDIQALVLQLRQALERQGLKLHSLTHNGRSVLSAETEPQPAQADATFDSSLSIPSPGAAS